MITRVLVVDDSAFARKVVREVLERAAGIEVVGTARDGLDALEQIASLRPDVVTLDLVMPNLDGLGVLDALPEGGPVVVVVSFSDAQSDLGVRALQAGAVDLVQKPTALATDQLYELGAELVAKVRAAANARPLPAAAPHPVPPRPPSGAFGLVVVGASTGGPQALTRLVQDLPAELPAPIVLALHIPSGYTAALARRLDRDVLPHVVEASNGLVLKPGTVVLAEGGKHLRLIRRNGDIVAQVGHEPRDALHRPSIDALFESAAALEGVRTLGVILTGMGDDGLRGAEAIRRAGGALLTEDASTCVVYGMPRRVWESGLSDASVPIGRMAEAIVERL